MPNSPATVRRATADDLSNGAAALASAFAGDPIFNWLIAKDIEPRLTGLFSAQLGSQLAKASHLVDVDDDARAVAVWYDADEWRSPPPEWRQLPRIFQLFGSRTLRAMRVSPAMESVHPDEPHRYLKFIGVHSAHQGTGLGGALLTSMTNECDDLGLPAYLESSNPVNDALYHRFGFQYRGLVPLPKGAPPMTAMWRDPR